jgi:hypothetical protein
MFRRLMRYDAGNTLKYKGNHEWLGTFLLNTTECDIVIMLDWYTKKIVSYYAGVPCKS